MRTHLVLTDEPVSFLSLHLPFHLHITERVIHPHQTESYSVPYYNSISLPSSDDPFQYCEYILTAVPPHHAISCSSSYWGRSPFDLLNLHGWLFVFHNTRYLCGASHQATDTFCRIKQTEWCVLLDKYHYNLNLYLLDSTLTLSPTFVQCWSKNPAALSFEITFFI